MRRLFERHVERVRDDERERQVWVIQETDRVCPRVGEWTGRLASPLSFHLLPPVLLIDRYGVTDISLIVSKNSLKVIDLSLFLSKMVKVH